MVDNSFFKASKAGNNKLLYSLFKKLKALMPQVDRLYVQHDIVIQSKKQTYEMVYKVKLCMYFQIHNSRFRHIAFWLIHSLLRFNMTNVIFRSTMTCWSTIIIGNHFLAISWFCVYKKKSNRILTVFYTVEQYNRVHLYRLFKKNTGTQNID